MLEPTPGAANEVTDRDHDGLPDAWEVQFGQDPYSVADTKSDPDGDGVSNLLEFATATDATDRNSAFKFVSMKSSLGGITISCATEPGKMYQLRFTSSLASGKWQDLGLPSPGSTFNDVSPGKSSEAPPQTDEGLA